MEINLPPDRADEYDYDSPNFILHQVIRGETSDLDVHIYRGSDERKTAEITSSFIITPSEDGKNLEISGTMSDDSDSILVKVHVDYQIDGLLTLEEFDSFVDFEYTFSVKIYASIFGIRSVFGVRGRKAK